ncbi:MAG: HK97 family phage prohead protease [Lactococcus lactis]|uniref:Phage head maturation protease n=1 Tax=Pseudolactococcus piscium MKFS47 TaxID=297352 RepID=A0A0D6DV44_9LACT|nr:HK97 family phage prohead protease [Lactococcus piscium]MDN5441093.1 HK97 family phage prohead protease [Lactococcus lactis]MDN5446062.1 HK97 family phage prohead protease [Lactococcus lactis]CEN27812.1 Phage head maturation protease [Lactococcus piscium MKFS47]
MRNLKNQFRSIGKLNTRDNTNDDEMKITGYFVVFNSETKLYENMFEEISDKAFENIDLSDIRALADHDTAKVLGRTKSQTLSLSVDEKGLFGEILINKDDTEAVNLYQRVKRGDIDQCSFGFNILNETMEQRADGTTKWIITEIELFEVSVVTFPAYDNTSVEARSNQIKQLEKRNLQTRKANLKERIKQWH